MLRNLNSEVKIRFLVKSLLVRTPPTLTPPTPLSCNACCQSAPPCRPPCLLWERSATSCNVHCQTWRANPITSCTAPPIVRSRLLQRKLLLLAELSFTDLLRCEQATSTLTVTATAIPQMAVQSGGELSPGTSTTTTTTVMRSGSSYTRPSCTPTPLPDFLPTPHSPGMGVSRGRSFVRELTRVLSSLRSSPASQVTA